jgi:hypothetical protein
MHEPATLPARRARYGKLKNLDSVTPAVPKPGDTFLAPWIASGTAASGVTVTAVYIVTPAGIVDPIGSPLPPMTLNWSAQFPALTPANPPSTPMSLVVMGRDGTNVVQTIVPFVNG